MTIANSRGDIRDANIAAYLDPAGAAAPSCCKATVVKTFELWYGKARPNSSRPDLTFGRSTEQNSHLATCLDARSVFTERWLADLAALTLPCVRCLPDLRGAARPAAR